MKKRALFIDRDGTLIFEPDLTYQIDSLEVLEFLPAVIRSLYAIRQRTDYELVMVSNQDGLGTAAYPTEQFQTVQNKLLTTLRNEDVIFDRIFIDPTTEAENKPTRKPGTAMLTDYMNGGYDLENSFVIGDRLTDMQLAANLGCRGILYNSPALLSENPRLKQVCALATTDWNRIADFLIGGERRAVVARKTRETDVYISLDLDGNGKTEVATGLNFFNHLLEQIGKHAGIDLTIRVKGDLEVDEHHTVEDTAIALGEALSKALGDKRGIERYGFCLPMDDCLCVAALDFGGRPWLVWDAEFHREKVGDLPTEMFMHFFKSLSDSAKMNLNIRAQGENEHHKIEGIFKAFAKAIKMAVKRDIFKFDLPSTKGVI
ncbi:MAG: bifunctional histidinol-phosphatase/imidazoleglycerol-phosphate dehydratase HisB [Dysgonamonadaceae bacterium]|jgi:imidazoleglycerol-phosphate dehydratase/histidinol-phosphatase|nr:bifunctional histidinol-phosphatase/imidazoleglycerol-phosphate dehydratase HisB [Dysgonamonadaceae bacterium]